MNADLFPESKQVFDYLTDFALKHSIIQHIKFNFDVISILQDESSSKWKVQVCESKSNNIELFMFDFIIIATGIFSKPYIPIPIHCPPFNINKDEFQGLRIHSKFYSQNRKSFLGKNVALIGNSFSSSEICTDLVDHATTIINVIHEPYWIILRHITVNDRKLPCDIVFYSQKSNDSSIKNQIKDPIQANRSKNQYFAKICSEQNNIESLKVTSDQDEPPKVSISDSYVEYVKEKKIQVKKGEISHLIKYGICFKDGSIVSNLDAIIYCTGFLASLDFFSEDIKNILEFEENDWFQPLLLHKCTFHPNLNKIAFVGLYK